MGIVLDLFFIALAWEIHPAAGLALGAVLALAYLTKRRA